MKVKIMLLNDEIFHRWLSWLKNFIEQRLSYDRKMNSILCIQKLYFGSEIAISHLLCEGEGEVGGGGVGSLKFGP